MFANPNIEDTIALQTSGRLMTIEKTRGRLNVNYSDRLAQLLSEVRQLQGLGFKIPLKILQFVNIGEKFYNYGLVLQEVKFFFFLLKIVIIFIGSSFL